VNGNTELKPRKIKVNQHQFITHTQDILSQVLL